MFRDQVSLSDVRWYIQSEMLEITSPYNDGFSTWPRKQRLYELFFLLEEQLEKAPTYAGEQEWLEEQKVQKAFNRLSK